MKFLIANILLAILPLTRWFGLKRRLLRLLGIEIGRDSCVCGYVQFHGAGNVKIGPSAWIGPNTHFYTAIGGNITLGERCDIAPNVIFVTGSHAIGSRHRRAGENKVASISVGDGTWIGVRATILPGATIGEGSVIGAGSVVRGGDSAPDTLLIGVPARALRRLPS